MHCTFFLLPIHCSSGHNWASPWSLVQSAKISKDLRTASTKWTPQWLFLAPDDLSLSLSFSVSPSSLNFLVLGVPQDPDSGSLLFPLCTLFWEIFKADDSVIYISDSNHSHISGPMAISGAPRPCRQNTFNFKLIVFSSGFDPSLSWCTTIRPVSKPGTCILSCPSLPIPDQFPGLADSNSGVLLHSSRPLPPPKLRPSSSLTENRGNSLLQWCSYIWLHPPALPDRGGQSQPHDCLS